ncbi:hypothetical protein BCV70DRAFT_167527 [Testicularia cyperi]|uniref:Uncharacterized protein n=1 Tax=Testicularia cyperi TaxID=1882483 RepID=A0A317XFI9_9BASI|nr:hypothetical protein BCV70DRAFT_167527 [Testicularia cyperi]
MLNTGSQTNTVEGRVGEERILFSPEDLALQLGAIELISAMWSGDGELTLPPCSERAIRSVADYLQLTLETLGNRDSLQLKHSIPAHVLVTLLIRPDTDTDTHPDANDPKQGRSLPLDVEIPLRRPAHKDSKNTKDVGVAHAQSESRIARLAVQSQPWFARNTRQHLDDIYDMVSHIMGVVEDVSEYILSCSTFSSSQGGIPRSKTSGTAPDQTDYSHYPVRRTWYYLPSLSSREKREDIVDAARHFVPPLTGFLLAGKPGLIVLEHPLLLAPSALDFWSSVKNESWSDIPSSHKKISEKLVEEVVPHPAFEGFADITHLPDIQAAADRGRKSDLSKLVRWLDTLPRGLGGVDGKWALEKCLGVGWS